MKVHIILNSHLDPVWGWRKSQGIDEVIATARTACDCLDDYPEIKVTRGESWFYETVEKLAPDVFKRICKHVENGRWSVVGGFYIQPDCNLPAAETFLKHGEIGQKYFESRFGFRVKTGYNVDSFGHAATLPDFYNQVGIENYVFHRPNRNEMTTLPAQIFHWQTEKGADLLSFRIHRGYCTSGVAYKQYIRANIEHSLSEIAQKVGHAMCFVGLGNHGGGPTRGEIEYLLEHPDCVPGVDICFSTPDEFFAAVKDAELPTYVGELQHHAIGCYSAISKIKKEVKAVETILIDTESMYKKEPQYFPFDTEERLEKSWKQVLFSTFHDILPGTSAKIAYEDIYDDLGRARSEARELLDDAIRLKTAAEISPCEYQQLIIDNPANIDYQGVFECEPWLGYTIYMNQKLPDYEFIDENGMLIPAQKIKTESASPWWRFALDLNVPKNSRKVIQIRAVEPKEQAETILPTLANDFKGVTYNIVSYDDKSDTWTHDVNSFSKENGDKFALENSIEWLNGALLSEKVDFYKSAESGSLKLRVRDFGKQQDMRELALQLLLTAEQKLVKMEFKLPDNFKAVKRRDGIPGGVLERSLNSEEYPVRNFVSISDETGKTFTIMGNFTSVDVAEDGTIGVTLLRSTLYFYHQPFVAPEKHFYHVSELGEHEFKLKMMWSSDFDADKIEKEFLALTQKLYFSESTLGCNRKLLQDPITPVE